MKVIGTPVTQEGLTQYDHFPAAIAVAKAWAQTGRFPTWHHRMQQIVRQQMPVLGKALDRLAEEYNGYIVQGDNK